MCQAERPRREPPAMLAFCQQWLLIRSRARLLLILLLSLNLSGCILNPRFVKLPQLLPRHPDIERRAAEYHDPYPDQSIGPDTGARPLGFHRQRSPTRRAAELRGVHQLDSNDRLPPTSSAPPSNRYGQVVEP